MEDERAIDAFLTEEAIAVMSTHNADGTIHSAPLLFIYEDGVFHMGTQAGARRVANLRRDPRATLLIERRDDPLASVMAYGTAAVIDGDVFERRVRILNRRYPADNARTFATYLHDDFGIVGIEFRPDHMVTIDYSRGGIQ